LHPNFKDVLQSEAGLEVQRADRSRFHVGSLRINLRGRLGQEPTLEELLAEMREVALHTTLGKVVEEQPVWLDGIYPGMQVTIQPPEGGLVVQRAYVGERRSGVCVFVLRALDARPADSEYFFNSFRFTADVFPPALRRGNYLHEPPADERPLGRPGGCYSTGRTLVERLPRRMPPGYVNKMASRNKEPGWFQPVGLLPPFLTVAVDPQAGAAFTTARSGCLKHYAYPRYEFQGDYWIEQAAYAAVLDGKRGLLFAAVSAPPRLTGKLRALGDTLDFQSGKVQGVGDLHVYDVKDLLTGKLAPGAVLRPAATVPLNARFACLLPSPDGRWLYFLDVREEHRPQLGRIDTAACQLDLLKPLPPRTAALCLTPDGKTLYAGVAPDPYTIPDNPTPRGRVLKIDAKQLEILSTVTVPSAPFDVAVTGAGLLPVSNGSGGISQLIFLDVPANKLRKLGGGYRAEYFRVTSDGKYLLTSPRGTTPARVEVFNLAPGVNVRKGVAQVLPLPEQSDPSPFYLTPDDAFVLLPGGGIFRLRGD
jgi:hypothetical protein